MFEGKVQQGQPLRTEPTNVVLHLFLLIAVLSFIFTLLQ